MRSYREAINWAANNSLNMPNPDKFPGKFIEWSEDICGIIAEIYGKDFNNVVEDLQEVLGLLE